MTASVRAFVGLGSNLGDRRAHVEAGLAGLAATPGVAVVAVSRAFENPAVGGPPQGAFWNAVAEIRTSLSPHDLLARLHAIEDAEGRVRGVPDGPRTLDLDLLASGAEESAPPRAAPALPHPRALLRAFVLRPWREIAPEFEVPGTGRSVEATGLTIEALDAALFAASPDAYADLRPAGLLAVRRPAVASARRPAVLVDRRALAAWRDGVRGTVGFVPTLGALHEGHASHARRARAECDAAIASIFVNPTQFGPNEDFTRYPRTFDADLDLLGREGVDAVYAPSREDVYPPGFATSVEVAGLSDRFEGAARPGHFRGVATVVARLMLSVRPDRTYFGRKDAQQVAIVTRMAKDLGLPGEIVLGPTVRDVDGLALSSRNRYLSPDDRARALAIPRALAAAAGEAARGVRESKRLIAVARRVFDSSQGDSTTGLAVDYADVVDPSTFEPVSRVEGDAVLIVAAKAGTTRLIDNERMVVPGPSTEVAPPAPVQPAPALSRAGRS